MTATDHGTPDGSQRPGWVLNTRGFRVALAGAVFCAVVAALAAPAFGNHSGEMAWRGFAVSLPIHVYLAGRWLR